MTCRAIANRMADMAGGQAGWDQLAEGMALRDAVSSTDAVSAIEQAESNKGNNGVPWVGGGNAGGSGQSSIKDRKSVVKGKSVSVRVDLVVSSIINNKTVTYTNR